MKKVLTIVLVFAVILAVLLGADALWKRFAPEPEPVEETEREMVVTNTMDPENATVIRLADGATTTLGVGAVVQADGASVTDDRAPFTHDGSGLSYMVAHRTSDGDVCESEDIEYSLASRALRLDWGKRFIELPYNLALSDAFEKDSEVRKHMDGTRQAYWNEGVTRKATLSTALIRFEDAQEQELLRDMLQYAGSVFVRTPDGLAFAADVQPGTIERSFDSGVVGVSLDAVEHDLTDEDKPGASDIVAPE